MVIEIVFEQTGIIDTDLHGKPWSKEQWQVRIGTTIHPVNIIYPFMWWRATAYTDLEGYIKLREIFQKLDSTVFMGLVRFKFYETKRIAKELQAL